MRIWAISDLHLGFSTGKWMDKFGEHWRDHPAKIERAWKECIEPGDLVMVPGDFSWAMKPAEVAIDFEWLSRLPGRKVFIKGNHDYWWQKSRKKMRAILPPDVEFLKKNALVVDGVPIVGVRGGDFVPWNERPQADIDAELERELRELELSIADLATLEGKEHAPIALFHYPPFPPGENESRFTRLIEDVGCTHALYGHLHSELDWGRFFQGEARGVEYRLCSCDYLEFRPILIETY